MGVSPSVHGPDQGGDTDQKHPIIDRDDLKRRSFSRKHSSEDTVNCPTCQGTGRIPRGQESKLVAVIPCTDHRLRPRHTKLWVSLTVVLCLLFSAALLSVLFPRSVLLSPVGVTSSMVYKTGHGVHINITNVLNISNQNFAEVKAKELSVQALDYLTVVGGVSIKNFSSVPPRSTKTLSFVLPVKLNNETSKYCENPAITVHYLYLHIQMSMTVQYLLHSEQLSVEAYEYIDCGKNSTTPHNVVPST